MKTLIKILCLSSFSIIFSKDLIFMNSGMKYNGTIKDKSQIFNNIEFITIHYKNNAIRNVPKSKILYIKLANGEVYNSWGLSIDEPDTKYYHLNTNKKLIQSASNNLISYRNKYYTGLAISFAGLLFGLSVENATVPGGLFMLIGGVIQILAVNDVGIAGEKLQRVDIKE